MTESMRNTVLDQFNRTSTTYPRDRPIHKLFEEQVRRNPEAIAIAFAGQQLTYLDLDVRANQLANMLVEQGVARASLVAICLDRSVEAIVSILAILKAGAVYVPLDSQYPAERIALVLEDTGASVILSTSELKETFKAFTGRVLLLDELRSKIDSLSTQNPNLKCSAEDLAYVMYTSGSTGRPRGVRITHRGVVRLVCGTNYTTIDSGDVFLQFASLSFDASTFEIWAPLLNGARLEIFPPGLPSLDELGKKIKDSGITTLWLTAALFNQMVDYHLDCLSEVRQLLTGGDVVSPSHARRFLERGSNCRLINGYGPTENTTFTCCFPMDSPDDVGTSVSIGRPISNTQVYVLDPDGEVLPVGVDGELYIGGDGLARDYLNDSDLTAEKFVHRSFGDHPPLRLYRTGDRVRWQMDGKLEFLGRLDRQIKIRGFRVEPGEIESVLREHSSVNDVLVHPSKGSREVRLVAYVTCDRNSGIRVEGLRDYLLSRLPVFMIPAEFVILERLPLTVNGKVDYALLPKPGSNRPGLENSFVAPTTELEIALAGIWQQVLHQERVGIHDNFIALGGDSLKAMEINVIAHKSLEIPLKPVSLFEYPTIAELIAAIPELTRGKSQSPVPRITSGDPHRLSSIQQGLWFLDQYDPDNRAYNIVLGYQITGPLDVTTLSKCFQAVVDRHDVLRTTFHAGYAGPEQRVQEDLPFQIEFADLSTLSPDKRQRELEHRLALISQHRFDLEKLPLIHAQVLKESEQEHRLFIAVHHIVFDGWSEGVLFRELKRHYQAFRSHEPSPLAELPLQFADYAAWEQQEVAGEPLRQELAWWKQQLAGAPTLLSLAANRPRPARQSFDGRTRFIQISGPMRAKLEALSAQHDVTLFMTFVAAFNVLLNRYSQNDDLVVGTVVANRNHAETAGLIGFFANALPLRTDLSGNPTFCQLLKRVKRAVIDLQAHHSVPMSKLVEALGIARDPACSNIFQVAIVLHNTSTDHLNLPGLEVLRLPVDSGTSKFDLTLTVVPKAEGLELAWEYSTVLFEEATIGNMAGDFIMLLNQIPGNPEQPIRTLLPGNKTESDGMESGPELSLPLAERVESESQVEAVLTDIWKKLLEVDHIGRHDNFFHAGGHSLLVTALAIEIEKACGRRVPVAQLFENNTIASQAKLFSDIPTNAEDSVLIPLCTHGKEAAVFLLPNIDGSAATFPFFVNLLRGSHPVYTVQLGADSRDSETKSFERMASKCVDLILASGQIAPFHLAGYSFGGMLAFEVARQLGERNTPVGVVAIIDAGPTIRRRASITSVANYLYRFSVNLPGWVLFNLSEPRELVKKFRRKVFGNVARMRSLITRPGDRGEWVRPDLIFDMHDKPATVRTAVQANLLAFFEYAPGHYPGQLTLFRARVRPLFHSLEADLAWSRVGIGGIEVFHVPGGHKHILRGEMGKRIAKQLKQTIDNFGLLE